ncbi:acyl-CoA dehydrogenase [Pseudoalteromonas luteoviolacea]|uniref:Acyl-coenzyme A dehydrogenase n=1 Tax=Pseudoalteromonas luteoviolacea TaxID=43657 RepID=A0A0C1QDV3_9GAMM|nr:acyl-CoA dehydrogenase [Pseudoalteromonas luteoviolacea]KID58836.1 acyl-CoA dehydrogenase [Pseudoalteromonas luteoviolacea]
MWLILLLIIAVWVIFAVKDIRLKWISKPTFNYFKCALPELSDTEKEAMKAGDTWWDASLFSGKPDWNMWLKSGKPRLSDEEQAFVNNELSELMAMLDETDITARGDLSKETWQFLREKGFFSMIIPKSFGGKEFSAQANSVIVSTIATRSLSAAVTVMVPNSLGPAELLLHFGTQAQQAQWLPKLASGEVLPCFALTSLHAGSDAGGITDHATVCRQQFEGQEVLGLKVTWSKRYITLAPVADVLGLAFKVYDPDKLLDEQVERGITCALIPTSHKGVTQGGRHDPMGLAFMNGTTSGKDVFIPLDWVIGGESGVGKGWRMLVSCLSAGRGISLPALSAGTAQLCAKSTSAYSQLRYQFKQPIGQFEGVQSAAARIYGLTYSIEAARENTALAVDLKKKPSVITAIAKYHLTEQARMVINDAMDIHGGKAIQKGPLNYLANHYAGMPISITVEGANILTRNLMIFGQGASRCHPFILQEMEAAQMADSEQGLKVFDKLLVEHIAHSGKNAVKALLNGLTVGRFVRSPVSGDVARYYQKLTWYSQVLSSLSDIAMLKLGGKLKYREMQSARLGDMLSHLYLASCVLKKYEDDGHQCGDLPLLHAAMSYHLSSYSRAMKSFVDNFLPRGLRSIVKRVFFPFGTRAQEMSDEQVKALCASVYENHTTRLRISALCPSQKMLGLEKLESALSLSKKVTSAYHDFLRWQKKQSVKLYDKSVTEQLGEACEAGVISEGDKQLLAEWLQLCDEALSVDVSSAS